MISTAITDLWYGFGVALEPHNLMYCFLGVLVGNLVGKRGVYQPSEFCSDVRKQEKRA